MAHPTVLIVDDDRTSREILAALTRFALPAETVEVCPEGSAAVPHLAAASLKLVISAHAMPELEDMCQQRSPGARRGTLPFMLMSSFDDVTWTQWGGPLPNVLAFLQKPSAPRDFMEMLRHVLPAGAQRSAAAS